MSENKSKEKEGIIRKIVSDTGFMSGQEIVDGIMERLPEEARKEILFGMRKEQKEQIILESIAKELIDDYVETMIDERVTGRDPKVEEPGSIAEFIRESLEGVFTVVEMLHAGDQELDFDQEGEVLN